MNLIQIMASNKHGGAERFFCRLAQSFAEQNLNQAVMLRKDSPYVNVLEGHLPYVSAPFSGLLDFKSKKCLKMLIQQQAPDIVMTWMNRASTLTSSLYRHKSYQHIARLGGYYNLKYYQHCDHFIANTKGISDYLVRSGISSKRVYYISNFANETPGIPLKRAHDRPLLLALGRLHTNKAFDTLIQAMAHVKEAELWIGGTGPEQARLEKLIAELALSDRVKLLGWIAQPEDLIATCDLLICPSRHEPLGNVILETWAQGKPILATQNQGAIELITHQKNGYLTPVDDPTKLAQGIINLLENETLLKAIATHGHKTYQQQFSKPIITQHYLDLFDQLLATRMDT